MLKKIKNVIKKLKKKKGFTLIELLAVIVILSILILLAMPSVLRIMENARKNAFETEVRAYLKAAQTKYAEKAVGNTANQTIVFESEAENKHVDIENKEGYNYEIEVEIQDGLPKYKYVIENKSYRAWGKKAGGNCSTEPNETDGSMKLFSTATPAVSYNDEICIIKK